MSVSAAVRENRPGDDYPLLTLLSTLRINISPPSTHMESVNPRIVMKEKPASVIAEQPIYV